MTTALRPLACFSLLAALTLGACSGQEEDGSPPSSLVQPALAAASSIRNVTVQEASALISAESPAVVVDVRTPEEFAEGHIEGAINVDVKSDSFIEDLAKLDKDAAYVVHCRSGRRSATALEAMKEAEFRDVAHMNEGMNGWSEAGLPLTR